MRLPLSRRAIPLLHDFSIRRCLLIRSHEGPVATLPSPCDVAIFNIALPDVFDGAKAEKGCVMWVSDRLANVPKGLGEIRRGYHCLRTKISRVILEDHLREIFESSFNTTLSGERTDGKGLGPVRSREGVVYIVGY